MSSSASASEAHQHGAGEGALVLMFVVLVRPRLWLTTLITVKGLIRTRWWRSAPFLPLPDPRWMGFRLETAYGSTSAALRAEDVVGYLEWCQMMRKIA